MFPLLALKSVKSKKGEGLLLLGKGWLSSDLFFLQRPRLLLHYLALTFA